MRPRLTWKLQAGVWWARLGDLPFGFVGMRADGSVYWNATNSVVMRWTAKGQGETNTIAKGRRAVNRAWNAWADRAGL